MPKEITILGDAVLLSGGAGSVAIEEVHRVAAAFEGLFRVAPRIRVTGVFPREAIKPGAADPYVEVWDLQVGSGSGYYPVLAVGAEYLAVQAWTGLNNGRALEVAPARGRRVKLRFVLPG